MALGASGFLAIALCVALLLPSTLGFAPSAGCGSLPALRGSAAGAPGVCAAAAGVHVGQPVGNQAGGAVLGIMGFLQRVFGLPDAQAQDEAGGKQGLVVRTGVRAKPTTEGEAKSRSPNKPSVAEGFTVSTEGAMGDYNQYRATALKNTPDRALSVMTTDVLESLMAEGWPLQEGDLGENVLVTGLPYSWFRVGRRFSVGDVLAEVTEPIQPCANLCRLPWMEQPKCKPFIKTLAARRGWYAKIISGGSVATGDAVMSPAAV